MKPFSGVIFGRRTLIALTLIAGVSVAAFVAADRLSVQLHRVARSYGIENPDWHWSGIRAPRATRRLTKYPIEVVASDISVKWDTEIIRAEIASLDLHVKDQQTSPTAAPKKNGESLPATQVKSKPAPNSSPSVLRDWLRNELRQRATNIQIRDETRVFLPGGVLLAIEDLALWHETLDAIPIYRATGNAALHANTLQTNAEDETKKWTFRCHFRGSSTDLRGLTCDLPDVHPRPLRVQKFRVSDRAIEASIADDASMRAHITFDEARRPIQIDLHRVPARTLTSLLQWIGIKIDIDPFIVSQAVLGGQFKLFWDSNRVYHFECDDVSISGLQLQAPAIATQTVDLPTITIRGSVAWSKLDEFSSQSSFQAQMNMGVGSIPVELNVDVQGHRLEVQADIAEKPCQEWFDTLPPQFRTILAGTQLEGDVGARLDLHTSLEELKRFLDAEQSAPGTGETPGKLDFEFPFRKNCSVREEPALVDLHALSRRYRHQFTATASRVDTRLLHPDAPDFVPLGAIDALAEAFVVVEDARFWEHDGFDLEQMERAFWYDLAGGKFGRGASTISQQTARTLWLGVNRNLSRKLQEAYLAWRMESTLSKRRILELYLNLIELGPGIHGVLEAADYYFKRPLQQLNLREKMFLATLPPAPVALARRSRNGSIDERWQAKIDDQIERLRIRGWISKKQAELATKDRIRLRNRSQSRQPD